ncbi:3'(2'),5'-bisphosphate nucleotidase CysQ [Marivirga atlantica]|jgi:3'(2'), 5'-bisphosphate nucleotidase|uniref:3'(2'),5'-bisphosphate nucleotidase CysQ n=1 Tax=Marivirga atlantica TaxID=1548457 RepID=A0A937AC37_9BACT|nr:3'(2'),5'-bisphosphate nucleotidase CysQ [Marivirga atlantica]MBL0763844.1 3'(2'),5'-bisphosphate nucleotidase CysQ [Marivirga atlantica]
MDQRELTREIMAIAKKAGEAIMDIYNNADLSNVVDYKADDSPLTLADKASENVIKPELERLVTKYPILSEEGRNIAYEEREGWTKFWLVDPLDGTKEFIKRNGQFTVNIALIDESYPVMGVIYVPATGVFYIGDNTGAMKVIDGEEIAIKVNNKSQERIAVRSASHASPEEDELLKTYQVKDSISVGSSLKFCMVAEGQADIYYRHGPTMEWDTGAGQAILEAAGGKVFKGNTEKERFDYNKENLLNGSFLCLGF